ncbi:MAG: hypothetical protein AAF708_13810, partial [Deinococcota bacterium]
MTLILSVSLLLTPANAQEVALAATLLEQDTTHDSTNDGFGIAVSLNDLELSGWTVGARAETAWESLALSFSASRRTTFGPLGNVLLAAETGVTTDLDGFVTLGARGTLGPVGANLSLFAYNAHPVAFDSRELASTARPHYSPVVLEDNVALGLRFGATYRLSRFLIASAEPTLIYLTDSGFGGHLQAGVSWRRLISTDNVGILLEGDLHPDGDQGYLASGIEYQLARRGLPVITASVWLGRSWLDADDGFDPGVRVRIEDRPGLLPLGYTLEAAFEPFRTDAPNTRLSLDTGLALPFGDIDVTARSVWGDT